MKCTAARHYCLQSCTSSWPGCMKALWGGAWLRCISCTPSEFPSEFSILALMGYDRYLAICDPLHYHSIMSQSRMGKLVSFTVLYPFLLFAGFYSLTVRLSFCGRVIPKLYCVNMELVKNSCSSVSYISILGLSLIVAFVVPQLLLIIFSYVQISRVCWKLKKESRRNALRTCVPHFLSLLNYTIGSLFEIAQTRLDMSHVISELQILLSLYFIVITPVANPVLYGLGTQIIRVHLMKLFLRHRILPAKPAKQRFEHRQSHVTCQKHWKHCALVLKACSQNTDNCPVFSLILNEIDCISKICFHCVAKYKTVLTFLHWGIPFNDYCLLTSVSCLDMRNSLEITISNKLILLIKDTWRWSNT